MARKNNKRKNGMEVALEALKEIPVEEFKSVNEGEFNLEALEEGTTEVQPATSEVIEEETKEEYIKIEGVNQMLVTKLNTGIKNAIFRGTELRNGHANCISSRELQAINKSYHLVTGVNLTDEQMAYMKKLNGTQAMYVSLTINHVLKELRTEQRELDRQAKASATN